MNVPRIVKNIKRKIERAPDRLALMILIWLENKPSGERILLPPSTSELHGPYLRYDERNNGNSRRRLAKKETAA